MKLQERVRFLLANWCLNACLLLLIGASYLVQMIASPSFYQTLLNTEADFVERSLIFGFAIFNYICHMTLLSTFVTCCLFPIVCLIRKTWVIQFSLIRSHRKKFDRILLNFTLQSSLCLLLVHSDPSTV